MLKKLSRFSLVILVILITCSVFLNIYASDYPERNVEVIVGFGAGGSTDTMVRVLALELEKRLGRRFIIINKPGAGGDIAWTTVANTEPDGYTLVCINNPSMLINPVLRPDSEYSIKDFDIIANVVTDPNVLVVRSDSPFKTLEDYVKYAKENPGLLNVVYTKWGDDHYAMTEFENAADIKGLLTNVQLQGSDALERAALLGGHVDSVCGNLSEHSEHVKSGDFRILAIATEERSPVFPDAPTFRESGYDVVSSGDRGIAAPKGIPVEIRKILTDTVRDIVENDSEYIYKMEEEINMPLNLIAGEEYYEILLVRGEKIAGYFAPAE